jgi:hypothetical protein
MKFMKKIKLALILLLAVSFVAVKSDAQVSVGVSIRIAPPVIPVYVQPACPTDGYLWVPGYWGYGDDGYYWVPGYWAAPPTVGFLWTPGYWGYDGGLYGWHGGYWGPHIGFYGGVNYGFGYGGVGYTGGGWEGRHFRYNTAVTNVNTTVVHNTYIDRTVINNRTTNSRTSFNGPGGIQARPSSQEQVAMNEHHVEATSAQVQHQNFAAHDRSAFASVNHGRPATAAVARPMTSAPHANPGATNHAAANLSHAGGGSPARPQQMHTVNRPQPQAHTVNRPQPQARSVNRPQPQVVHQAPQHAAPRPAPHPAPHPAPRPAAPREGGGEGGERHHR